MHESIIRGLGTTMRQAGENGAAGIPAYALYGDADPGRIPAGVHVETIHVRSSRLDWRIRPHRHAALFQAIWIAAGHARAFVEGEAVELAPGSFAFIPPLIVHGYDFEADTAGIVVTVPGPLLTAALAQAPDALAALSRPVLLPGLEAFRPDEFAEARFLFETLLGEHCKFQIARACGLSARAALLALWFARQAPEREPPRAARNGIAVVRRFLAEVEASYAAPRPLGDYARDLGVSMPHLGRLCRGITGRSPLALVHDRRLVEAKRLLVYTGSPVGDIAARLGFDSPAYFSRFFRSRTGQSPLAFRQAAEAGVQ